MNRDHLTNEKEESYMAKRAISRSVMAGMLVSTFAAGFLCGSLNQRSADAQLQELGGAAAKQAMGSGALGAVGELGTSIMEMQDHVSGLQKNIDTLKKVQSSLTGK
jgi:hypothetical protein